MTTLEVVLNDEAARLLTMIEEGIDPKTGGMRRVFWAQYGPHTWMICETCDTGHHTCGGCGADMTHAHPSCKECLEELDEMLRRRDEWEAANVPKR